VSLWSAELELELACKVGSAKDFERAISEGADVNWDGSAPLFLAMMGGHRQLIARLVELGADPSPFLSQNRIHRLSGREELVAALCENCPPPVEGADEGPPDDPSEEYAGIGPFVVVDDEE
jgi:hypothetical protein